MKTDKINEVAKALSLLNQDKLNEAKTTLENILIKDEIEPATMKKQQFITERTRIISEMLDNPDEYEIYPTGKCFEQLDILFDKITSEPTTEEKEENPNRFLDEYRKEADFINERYGISDEDHKTALEIGHIYDLMKSYAIKYAQSKKGE